MAGMTTLNDTMSTTYQFVTPTTNRITPAGNGAWLTIKLTEVDDFTQIYIKANLQSPGEFISKIAFNLAPVDYSKVKFTESNLTIGNDIFNGGGNEKFDLLLAFDTANKNRFDGDDEFTFIVNLPIASFTNYGDQLPAIAHIQSIGTASDSTWLKPTAIPEPSAILLSCAGLVFLMTKRKK